jgi:hypothetical protein
VLKISSSDKRKHKTLNAKAEIIKQLVKSENLLIWLKSIVLGMLRHTISGKNREKIQCFVNNFDSGPSDRHTLKSGESPEVEDALYFLQ